MGAALAQTPPDIMIQCFQLQLEMSAKPHPIFEYLVKDHVIQWKPYFEE